MRAQRVIIGLLLVTGIGCASSTPTGDPGVTQEGRNRVWFRGSEVVAEVFYGTLVRQLGGQHAVLRVGFYSRAGTVEVKRSDIRLTTPDGTVLAPLDQTAFREIYGQLRMALIRDNSWFGPSERFMGSRDLCDRWFIFPPDLSADDGFTGQRHGFESIFVSNFRTCGGPLVFPVLMGVQPGRWVLTVELEETTARIPFVVELESGA